MKRLVSLALVLSACSAAPAVVPDVTVPPTPSTTVDLPVIEVEAIDWNDPSIVAESPDGWSIHACPGDAPMLCVERDGEVVGVAEALAFPADSFDGIDPSAPALDQLRVLATDFIGSMAEDRSIGCGADYVFEAHDVDSFPLGGGGVSYGFRGEQADGSPSELNHQYATLVDGMFVMVVAAAYDEGGCPGRDDTSTWDTATLEAARPFLESVLAASPVPQLG